MRRMEIILKLLILKSNNETICTRRGMYTSTKSQTKEKIELSACSWKICCQKKIFSHFRFRELMGELWSVVDWHLTVETDTIQFAGSVFLSALSVFFLFSKFSSLKTFGEQVKLSTFIRVWDSFSDDIFNEKLIPISVKQNRQNDQNKRKIHAMNWIEIPKKMTKRSLITNISRNILLSFDFPNCRRNSKIKIIWLFFIGLQMIKMLAKIGSSHGFYKFWIFIYVTRSFDFLTNQRMDFVMFFVLIFVLFLIFCLSFSYFFVISFVWTLLLFLSSLLYLSLHPFIHHNLTCAFCLCFVLIQQKFVWFEVVLCLSHGFICVCEQKSFSVVFRSSKRFIWHSEIQLNKTRNQFDRSALKNSFAIVDIQSHFELINFIFIFFHKTFSHRIITAKRGKGKKKKKKALMKLLLIGAVLKSKIELLLKILGTHLQIKFFIISVISLIVNIARFWVDLKRSQNPQKVFISHSSGLLCCFEWKKKLEKMVKNTLYFDSTTKRTTKIWWHFVDLADGHKHSFTQLTEHFISLLLFLKNWCEELVTRIAIT